VVIIMGNAYWKDIWRTVKKEKKRFISIAVIATLGVTMMCGLRASCVDLRYSADAFFDEQKLFDIRVISTLGITENDLAALKKVEGVAEVEGGYSETVYTIHDDVRKSIEVHMLSENEFNMPYLLEGKLPENKDEIVVTRKYLLETGKGLGDEIVLDEKPENLESRKYTITGIIVDAMDINSTEGSMAFRSTATTDYVGYVIPAAVDSDIYTSAYLMVEGSKELNCYTDEYEDTVEAVVNRIEKEIKKQREQERYQEVYDEAMEEWLEGKQEADEEFAKADKEIADAKEELADGRRELIQAEEDIADGRRQIADGREQIADGREELKRQEKKARQEFSKARKDMEEGHDNLLEGEKELEKAYEELIAGQQELDAGKAELEAQEKAAREQIAEGYAQLDAAENELQAGYEAAKQAVDTLNDQILQVELALQNEQLTEEERLVLEGTLQELHTNLAMAQGMLSQVEAQVAAGREQIDAQRAELKKQEELAEEQFAAAREELEQAQEELDAGMQAYLQGVEEIERGKEELADGEAELERQEKAAFEAIEEAYAELEEAEEELNEGERELEDGETELLEGKQELLDGEAELAENIAEYEKEKADALEELAEAKEEIDDIDMTKWYVQDRNALSGFSNVKSDASSIQAIGDIFPVLFLIIAILISLTTITRMVDEERGLVGTYQALGFTNKEIRRKYMIFAAASCLIGGAVGDIGGYVILPQFIFTVFHVMYLLPEYSMQFDVLFGFGGILLFEIGILSATIYAVERKLRHMPATLMRPKAPKSGSRVLLERIGFVWNRLSFLNKVTARNLFRYKKRMFMTIFGIMGCTALLLCGFTIKNTVSEMIPQQYEHVYRYDLMAVSMDDDYDELALKMENDAEVDTYIPTRIESVEIFNQEGKKTQIQLIVVEDGKEFESYICLKDKKKKEYILEDGDIFLTRNATRILALETGDILTWQNQDLVEAKAAFTQTVENYLGNAAYMTVSTYEEMFGKYVRNGVLANFSDECKDPADYADTLVREEGILSAISTEQMAAEFEPAFALINMVVYIVLILAAMLAFVVLFTLSNTNISERERELATIKVLGFYDFEVHSYVNKETMILTGLGILFGMPAGWLLGRYVMGILEFPSLEFYIALYPESYAIAAVITIVFALTVNAITDRSLNKIDMIEALKSVE